MPVLETSGRSDRLESALLRALTLVNMSPDSTLVELIDKLCDEAGCKLKDIPPESTFVEILNKLCNEIESKQRDCVLDSLD
jgi:hypothetical protein